MMSTQASSASGGAPRTRTSTTIRAITFGSALVAVAAFLVAAPAWLVGISRYVGAYDVGTIVLITLLWTLSVHRDPARTRGRAAIEDPGRNVVFLVVLVTGLVGIVSAVSILGFGPHLATKPEKALAVAFAIVGVVTGWLLMHTTFVLRYAHLFYSDGDGDRKSDGGLKFPGTEEPSDYDFAYFSFVVGMTFQVSDVIVQDTSMRRLVLAHGLIAFAYNTALIALVINMTSSLLH